MKILISAGHTIKGKGTGAVGHVNESNENRVLAKKIVSYLKMAGHEVDYHEVNEANDYLHQQTNFANKKKYDLVVQIHFNAGGGVGTETLYSSSKGKVWADRVTTRLGQVYKQRGSKQRTDLHWLNKTTATAILIETCFVDSKSDTDTYILNKDLTAKLIAEGIHQKPIIDSNKPTETDKFYKVCLIACKDRDNAVKVRNEAIAKGFKDAYMIYE